jgi:hypothetical protein
MPKLQCKWNFWQWLGNAVVSVVYLLFTASVTRTMALSGKWAVKYACRSLEIYYHIHGLS